MTLGGEKMKKDIALIVIIVAVLCIGAINTVNAKEYVRDDYIITVSERCKWMWTHGDKLYSTPSDSEFHCDQRLKINIWVSESFKVPIPDGHPISSLQDAIDFEHELFDQPWEEKEITNTYQMTTRNGYDVYVIECIPDSQCLEKRYYIPKGDGTTCIIECRTSNKYYDEMIRDICEPAVQSFKFTGEPTPTQTPTPTPEPEQCLEYYIKYEGKQRHADMYKDGEKLYMYFENGTAVPWIFETSIFHTFDCSEMSAMYERRFENLGYNAKIRCTKFNLFKAGHCWVVLENKNGSWTVFEATTQKIIKDACKIKARYSSWGGEYKTIKDVPWYIRYISFNWWDHFDEYKDIKWCPIEAST